MSEQLSSTISTANKAVNCVANKATTNNFANTKQKSTTPVLLTGNNENDGKMLPESTTLIKLFYRFHTSSTTITMFLDCLTLIDLVHFNSTCTTTRTNSAKIFRSVSKLEFLHDSHLLQVEHAAIPIHAALHERSYTPTRADFPTTFRADFPTTFHRPWMEYVTERKISTLNTFHRSVIIEHRPHSVPKFTEVDKIMSQLIKTWERNNAPQKIQTMDGILHYEWMNVALRNCNSLETLRLYCPFDLQPVKKTVRYYDEGLFDWHEQTLFREQLNQAIVSYADIHQPDEPYDTLCQDCGMGLYEQDAEWKSYTSTTTRIPLCSRCHLCYDQVAKENEKESFKLINLFHPKWCPNLKHLTLSNLSVLGDEDNWMPGMCDAVLEDIAQSIHQYGGTLETLDVSNSRGITEKGFMEIVRVCTSSMKHINISMTCIHSNCFEELFSLCPNLQTFHMGENVAECSQQGADSFHMERTDEDIALLCSFCPNIDDLDISGFHGSVAGGIRQIMKRYPNMKKFKADNIGWCFPHKPYHWYDEQEGNIPYLNNTEKCDFMKTILDPVQGCWLNLESLHGSFVSTQDNFTSVFCVKVKQPTVLSNYIKTSYEKDPMYVMRSLYDTPPVEPYDVPCVDCGMYMYIDDENTHEICTSSMQGSHSNGERHDTRQAESNHSTTYRRDEEMSFQESVISHAENQNKSCASYRCSRCHACYTYHDEHHSSDLSLSAVPFHIACANGLIDVVRQQLDLHQKYYPPGTDRPSKILLNIHQKFGFCSMTINGHRCRMTTIMFAVASGHSDVVELLLNAKGKEIFANNQGYYDDVVAMARANKYSFIEKLLHNVAGVIHQQIFRDYKNIHIGKSGHQLIVVKATYGCDKRRDYSGEIQELVNRNEGRLDVDGGIHTVLGDPEFHRPKTFQIEYFIRKFYDDGPRML